MSAKHKRKRVPAAGKELTAALIVLLQHCLNFTETAAAEMKAVLVTVCLATQLLH